MYREKYAIPSAVGKKISKRMHEDITCNVAQTGISLMCV